MGYGECRFEVFCADGFLVVGLTHVVGFVRQSDDEF